MDIPDISSCPNCKGTKFGGVENSQGVLLSGDKNQDGNYEINYNKVLGLTPIICESCGLVMLFRTDNLA